MLFDRLAGGRVDLCDANLIDAGLAVAIPRGVNQFGAVGRPIGPTGFPEIVGDFDFRRVEVFGAADPDVVGGAGFIVIRSVAMRIAMRVPGDPAAVGRPLDGKVFVVTDDEGFGIAGGKNLGR